MTWTRELSSRQYRALAELRYQIRRFLAFSELASREAGVEPQQHQLLLVLKTLRPEERPTVAVVAQRLQIRHNSAVDLVKRSAERGLIERRTSSTDRREASLQITASGQRLLRRLSIAHKKELGSAGPVLVGALEEILGRRASSRTSAPTSRASS